MNRLTPEVSQQNLEMPSSEQIQRLFQVYWDRTHIDNNGGNSESSECCEIVELSKKYSPLDLKLYLEWEDAIAEYVRRYDWPAYVNQEAASLK